MFLVKTLVPVCSKCSQPATPESPYTLTGFGGKRGVTVRWLSTWTCLGCGQVMRLLAPAKGKSGIRQPS